jgi:TPR repeat protein
MSLEDVVPRGELERPRYHLLSWKELEALDDPEALYERGRRFRNGICCVREPEKGWKLNIEAARFGHPVALASCFDQGQGVQKNEPRAFALYRESAARGHPAGAARCFACLAFFLVFKRTSHSSDDQYRIHLWT